jgi:hypothetical protein
VIPAFVLKVAGESLVHNSCVAHGRSNLSNRERTGNSKEGFLVKIVCARNEEYSFPIVMKYRYVETD